MRRLECCQIEEDKPTCSQCPVHCYKTEMRDRIRDVMRYAGPRMMLRHPILAFQHMLDERRSRWERMIERVRLHDIDAWREPQKLHPAPTPDGLVQID